MYTTLAMVHFLATGCDATCQQNGKDFVDLIHNGVTGPIVTVVKYLLVAVIAFGFAKRMGDHRESAIMHIVEAGAMIGLVMIVVPLLQNIL